MQYATQRRRLWLNLFALPIAFCGCKFAICLHTHRCTLAFVCAVSMCVCVCEYAQPWLCLYGCPLAASVALAALAVYYNCIYHANTYTQTGNISTNRNTSTNMPHSRPTLSHVPPLSLSPALSASLFSPTVILFFSPSICLKVLDRGAGLGVPGFWRIIL